MLASESIKVCDDAIPPLIVLQRDSKAVNMCAAEDLGEISGGEKIRPILSMRSAVAEVHLSSPETSMQIKHYGSRQYSLENIYAAVTASKPLSGHMCSYLRRSGPPCARLEDSGPW